MMAIGLVVAGVLFVWRLARWGDDLHAWAQEWRHFKAKGRSRRWSPYLVVGVLVAAVVLFVRSGSLRKVSGLGLMMLAELTWAFVSWAQHRWVWFAGAAGAFSLVHQRQKRARYMAGEPSTPAGTARAAARAMVAAATMSSLPALRGSGTDDKVPAVGKVSYLSARLGDRRWEYGMRVRLHMRRGFTPKSLRGFTSDGMAPEDDTLATYVNSHMREAADRKTPDARQLLAFTRGELLVLPYSAITYVTTPRGDVDPSQCDLLLMQENPLTRTVPYPARRPKVSSLATPLLVGVDLNAQPVRMRLREQMTGVFGATNTGKSFYTLNLAIGASQCPNVAFVVIDMKGPSGDLMSLQARAAACATDHDEATVTLEWLVAEMDRRARMGGAVGKLTKFSPDCPEIVAWFDEWHEFSYPIPNDDAGKLRLRLLERLIRRARAFGIYIVAATQIVHAKDVPTSITGQFHNVVSTRLGKRDHSGMVFQGQLPDKIGPHLIPPDWRGVAYGRFEGRGTIDMMRSLLSGPEVAARWAETDAKAGLNVPLPGLVEALQKHHDREPVTVAVGASTNGGHTMTADLPASVLSAVEACCVALEVAVPETVSVRDLRDLSQRAGRKVHNRRGVTETERAELDAFRETIRAFTNPDT